MDHQILICATWEFLEASGADTISFKRLCEVCGVEIGINDQQATLPQGTTLMCMDCAFKVIPDGVEPEYLPGQLEHLMKELGMSEDGIKRFASEIMKTGKAFAKKS